MVIGAMLVKHITHLSNQDTIEMIQENPYMQYLEVRKGLLGPQLDKLATEGMEKCTFLAKTCTFISFSFVIR